MHVGIRRYLSHCNAEYAIAMKIMEALEEFPTSNFYYRLSLS